MTQEEKFKEVLERWCEYVFDALPVYKIAKFYLGIIDKKVVVSNFITNYISNSNPIYLHTFDNEEKLELFLAGVSDKNIDDILD